MKKSIILIGFFTCLTGSAFNQNLDNDIIALRNFYAQRLDSVNTLNKGEISKYLETYYCCISFQVDEQGQLKDALIIEDPKMPMAAWAKDYLLKIFKKASGACFLADENDLKSQLSKERHFVSVVLRSLNQSPKKSYEIIGNRAVFIMQTEGTFPHYALPGNTTVFLTY